MSNKWVILVLIILFVGASSTSVAYTNDVVCSSSFGGTVLYVGGSGPGNFSRIQDAIDNASDGDTVFVFDDLSPYVEELVIDKMIFLQGEDRDTTIVVGGVDVVYDGVQIAGFTIEGVLEIWDPQDSVEDVVVADTIILVGGLQIYGCSNVSVFGTVLYGSGGEFGESLSVSDSELISISENVIGTSFNHSGDSYCCVIQNLNDSQIIGNTFHDAKMVFQIISGANVNVTNNIFTNISGGCGFQYSSYIQFTRNDCSQGRMYVAGCRFCLVAENNLLNSSQCIWYRGIGNKWDNNFWGQARVLPMPIYSLLHYIILESYGVSVPLFMLFDWHPAQEPYDIPWMM